MNVEERRQKLLKRFSITDKAPTVKTKKVLTTLDTFARAYEKKMNDEIERTGVNITALEVVPEIVDRKPTGNVKDVVTHKGTVIADKVILKDPNTGDTQDGYIIGNHISTYWNKPKKVIVTELFQNEIDDEKENAENAERIKNLQSKNPVAVVEIDFNLI